jgi:homoserine kinase type II
MLRQPFTLSEIEAVLAHFSVGTLTEPPGPGGGTANANVVIETTTGRFFLKRRNPKYADPAFVAFDHRLMEHLARYAVPTPLAIPTREGERWLAMDGAIYEFYPFRTGLPHNLRSLPQIAAAGRALADYHRATRSFDPPPGKDWPRYHDPRMIREGVRAIRSELTRRMPADDLPYLDAQIALLERELTDARYHALPKLVVHGDYHPGNLLFDGDDVAGIFDLDWATEQPRALDLADGLFLFAGERATVIDAADIVSLTQTWTPSPARERVFLDAYRECESITCEETAALGLLLRARWLYCRVQGMAKLPQERRAFYFVKGLLDPLRALDVWSSP